MTDQERGPNVRKLNYLGGYRLSPQSDGSWAAVPAGGPESEAQIVRGATPEAAAGALLARLEQEGVYVPEPPEDYLRQR